MEERFAVVNEVCFFRFSMSKKKNLVTPNGSGALKPLILAGREDASSIILKEIW